MDYVELSSRSAHVRVTAAALIHPVGGIKVVRVGFAEDGDVGGGFPTKDGASQLPSASSGLYRLIPAELDHADTHPNASVGDRDGSDWQLVVVVSLPSQSKLASADGVRLTYTSGSNTRHLVTQDTMKLVAPPGKCSFSS